MTYSIAHIESYFQGQKQAIAVLTREKEVSLASQIEGNLAKTLIVASASFFEDALKEGVLSHVRASSSNTSIVEFCRIVAIDRQYHTWFDWKSPNANSFFGIFGEHVKARGVMLYKSDPNLTAAVGSFMYLGSQRKSDRASQYAGLHSRGYV